jgi:hypothetical protein
MKLPQEGSLSQGYLAYFVKASSASFSSPKELGMGLAHVLAAFICYFSFSVLFFCPATSLIIPDSLLVFLSSEYSLSFFA